MAAPRSEPLSINTQFMANISVGSRFTDLRPIGYGANGLVFAGIDSECDKHVAIKKISFHDQISCKFALREIKIMRGLEHDSIVKVHECLGPDGASLEAVGCDLPAVYIIQELLDTDLHCLIQSGQLTEQHTQLFMYQLLRGLKYLHSANVVHRDLKPSNLLVNYDDLTLKITDFGLARILDPNYNHKGYLTENLGTTWYKSPEVILTPKDYDSSVDIWSAGCIFGEMLLGRAIFPGAHEINQLHLILDSIELEDSDWNHVMRWMPNKLLKNHPLETRTPLRERLPDVHPLGIDLLERLLRFNPADRLTAEEALTHPYFLDLHYSQDEHVVETPFSIEHEVDDLTPAVLKEMIVSEVIQPVSCGQKIAVETALPSKIVNKNLRNQLIHSGATLGKCKGNQDTEGTPIVTESKATGFNLGSGDENPSKLEFFREKSTESSNSKQFSIEEVNSNEEASDREKESYQSMLEHLNKLNMAKSLIETPKKKKSEVMMKKEVEKGYDDEKDTAEYSTRKYEEDQELSIMKIKYDNESNETFDHCYDVNINQIDTDGDTKLTVKNVEPLLIEDFMFPRTNTVIDSEMKHKTEENNPHCKKRLTFDALMAENDSYNAAENKNQNKNGFVQEPFDKCFEALTIDTEEIENFKEFSQPSPKENSGIADGNVNGFNHRTVWNDFDNMNETKNETNVTEPCSTEVLEESDNGANQTQTTAEEECSDDSNTGSNTNLMLLRNFGNSQESDLDSILSSDSNKLFEESHSLTNSGLFSSTEKLKEVCDTENERCRTPNEQIPDKETIKRKLNELNQKKLKDMANIGVPTIEEHPETSDKNDKNRPGLNQGCRPKVFTSTNAAVPASGRIQPNFPQVRPRARSRPINLHKLRQEINERLKREEVQASMGELAAGGGWDFINTDSDTISISSQRHDEDSVFDQHAASSNTCDSVSSRHNTPDEYALPQPRWPCGEVSPMVNQESTTGENNTNNNSNTCAQRRGSNRTTRRKAAKKTKAL